MHLTNYSLNKHNARKYVHASAGGGSSSEEEEDEEEEDEEDAALAEARDILRATDNLSKPKGLPQPQPPPTLALHSPSLTQRWALVCGAAAPTASAAGAGAGAAPASASHRRVAPNDEGATKRTLSAVMRRLAADGADVNAVWRSIQGVVARTILAMQVSNPMRKGGMRDVVTPVT